MSILRKEKKKLYQNPKIALIDKQDMYFMYYNL